MRPSPPLAAAALALLTPLMPATASAAPAAVDRAAAGVVSLSSATGQGSAVRLGDDGSTFLTSSALVARTEEITVARGPRDSTLAERVESDAPTGLVLLRVPGTPTKGRTLEPSPTRARTGQTVWFVARIREKDRLDGPTQTTVRRSSGGIVETGLKAADGIGRNGGALLDDGGRLVGVVVPPAPGVMCRTTGSGSCIAGSPGAKPSALPLQAVSVIAAPSEQTGAVASTETSFPAIPVTVGLGVVLLLGQLLLRRRKPTAGPAAPVPAAAPLAPVPAGPAAEDDFEITLRPKG